MAVALRRYRCLDVECGWEGLLARPAPGASTRPEALVAGVVAAQGLAASGARTATAYGRRMLMGLAAAAAVAVPLAVIGVSGLELVARPSTGLAALPGESHDGLALRDRQAPIGGALLRARFDPPTGLTTGDPMALTLRQGCAWGQPGRQPYRGTTEQALNAAGLPPEVVQEIAAQRQAGRKTGRLEISRNAIRQIDGTRRFNPRSMALSFGLTLCLNSRVNFAPGHVEPADLYEARDATGRLHSVMVPDVCGNVTVLSAPAPGGVVAGVAGALAQRSEALATVAEALVSDAESADPGDPGDPVAGAGAAGRSAFASGGAREPGTAFAQAVAPGTRTTTGGAVAWAPVGPVGSAPAAQASAPGIGKVLWQGLRSSTVPRAVSTVGLKRVADGLARSGETVRALATLPIDPDLPDDRPGARPGVVDVGGVTQTRDVPEPGSLACVLAALAAAWWVGRRRALRQAAQR